MKGLTLMYDYRSKDAGTIVSAIGVLTIIAAKIWKFSLFHQLSADQNYLVFLWGTLFGFYIMAFSKEKNDDERVKKVRANAMQFAFCLLVGILLSFSLIYTLKLNNLNLSTEVLYMFPTMALLMYLLVFNVGLHFDFLWEYEDKGLVENLKNVDKNKWGILAYVLICVVLFAIITFIF